MERPSDGSETLVDKPSFLARMFKDWDKSMIITVTILLSAIITLIFILIFCFLGEVDPDCTKTIPSDYKECPIEGNFLFNDDISDFFLDTQLNESKWFDFGTTFLGSRIGSYFFASNNVKVKDGCLRLTARKLKDSESENEENKYRGFTKFATSIVKSIKKVKYGYFEIRAKAMNANVANAFWLYDPLSDDLTTKFSTGNHSEEIDIFRLIGNYNNESDPSKYYYNNTVHLFKTPYVEAMIVDEEEVDGYNISKHAEYDFYNDFHKWGFLWNESDLIWYLDDKLVCYRKNDFFNRSLHITFDTEAIESTQLDESKEFKIDYFKYWELQEKFNPE